MHRIKRYNPWPPLQRVTRWAVRRRRALLIRAAYGAAGGVGSACITLIVFFAERRL